MGSWDALRNHWADIHHVRIIRETVNTLKALAEAPYNYTSQSVATQALASALHSIRAGLDAGRAGGPSLDRFLAGLAQQRERIETDRSDLAFG